MTIGERLRQAREARQVTLHAIAEKTNISVRFLDAMEKGQVEKLPGGIFTRGFVRSYATQVGLDPDETVRAFVAAHPQLRNDDGADEVRQQSGSPAGMTVVVAVLVLLAVAVGIYWWMARSAAGTTATGAQHTPASAASAATSPATSPATPVPPPVAETRPVGAADPGSTPENEATLRPPGSTGGPDPGVSMPAEAPAPSTMPLRLTLVPSGRCWVQVKADGRVLLAREVNSGERVDIEAGWQLEIVAGDAGAFGYQLNGRRGRSLGAAGRVGRATITTTNLSEFQES